MTTGPGDSRDIATVKAVAEPVEDAEAGTSRSGAVDGWRRRLARASLWTTASFAVTTATGPVVAVALVRLMSRQQYGELAVATALVSLLAVLCGYWLAPAVTQIASAEGAVNGTAGMAAVLRGALRVTAVAGLVALALSAVAALVAASVPVLRGSAPALAAMIPVVVLAPCTGLAVGFLRAAFHARRLSVATALSSVVSALLIVAALVVGHPSSLTIGAVRSIGTVVLTVLLIVPVVRWARAHPVPRPERLPTRRIVTFGCATLLSAVFAMAVSQLDVFVLGVSRGSNVAALYTPASAVADGVMSLQPIIGSFFLPTITAMAALGNLDGVRGSYHWANRWNVVLCAPAIAVLLVCPGSIMRLLFGGAFGTMATQLRILGVGASVQILLGYNGLTLDGFGLPRVVAWRQGASLAVSGIACATLIPVIGSTGAALATAIALVMANVLCSLTLAVRFHIGPWDRRVATTVAGLAAGAGVAWVLDQYLNADLVRVLATLLAGGAVTGMTALMVGDDGERRAVMVQVRRLSTLVHFR